MKDKTVYFIGKLFADFPKAGDEIAYLGIDLNSERWYTI